MSLAGAAGLCFRQQPGRSEVRSVSPERVGLFVGADELVNINMFATMCLCESGLNVQIFSPHYARSSSCDVTL
jgi:hypothetical protein